MLKIILITFSIILLPLKIQGLELGEDGLYKQPWINETFMDLREDLEEANANNQRFMILFEQRGCGYCKRMHKKIYSIPEIASTLNDDFFVIRINIFGDLEVIDFDGEILIEKEIVKKWGVIFTPTVMFLPIKVADGKTASQSSVVTMPGAFEKRTTKFLLEWVLLNDLVDEDFKLSHENFTSIDLPNEKNFFLDNRNILENEIFIKRCMKNCKSEAKITKRALVLGVTPDTATEQLAIKEEAQETTSLSLQLVKDGENVFKKCKACHRIGENAKHGTGPHLNNIFGRIAGSLIDYKKYSKNIRSAGKKGLIWDSETLSDFIQNPKKYLAGTKMNFKGINNISDRSALIEYIKATSSLNN